ncbi:MAG TPA: hypothetical protein VIA18_13725 [Polyangia bacterium]|nr:hypothetical protein [Polyangia bacterium]
MAKLIDCPTCGGLIPSDRRCCPHCHCKTSLWKHWMLLVSAALGIGAAGCDKTTYANHYGTSMTGGSGGGLGGGGGTVARDMAVPDLGGSDGGEPDGGQ